ncbi:MAG TPA: Ni/Fe hydrogenase subunit alpha, partial [Thermoprotei archaeon]|nr:Ni/Fe hydrogenase subunit alpha [Thermoprotei archaeon]
MKVVISPFTRVEGHAKVVLKLSEDGAVKEAKFKVLEFRGFEKILEGRPIEEAPRIASRICGICQVAHSLASAKAAERALGIEPPEDAIRLRRIMHYAGVIQSHLLHLIFLALPDYLPTRASSPLEYLFNNRKDLLKETIAARSASQKIVEIVGGKSIHPTTNLVGGIAKPPSREDWRKLLNSSKSLVLSLKKIFGELEQIFEEKAEELREYFELKTWYLALARDGEGDFYDGDLMFKGETDSFRLPPEEYHKVILEETVAHSYIKYPYLVKGEKKLVRVGPLARHNISSPDVENNSLYYNVFRLKECIKLADEISTLLDRPFKEKTFSKLVLRRGEGVGIVEAPRGLLVHHYKSDENGILEKVNIIVPTTINAPSIEKLLE